MSANYTLANKLHLFAILVILIVLTLSWLFPRQSSVSESTMGKLDDLVSLMEQVNKNVNTAMEEQRIINNTLLASYNKREEYNNAAYENLLEKYGLDVPATPGTNKDVKPPITIDKTSLKNANSYDELLGLHGCVDGVCK